MHSWPYACLQLLSFGALFAAAAVVPGAKADLVSNIYLGESTRREAWLYSSRSIALNVKHACVPLLQTSELLEKSKANKALHDKQRLATSGANFHSSRCVLSEEDPTCNLVSNKQHTNK